ncbi:M15 family metallopeptidase [Thalassotalea sp. SU-HH00458]|uniref:M15 family metallopeptidase n=1 Tax=Thalassotalea sp. SU-HH00458 TaxID=3127657 RepID=UPI00310C2A05
MNIESLTGQSDQHIHWLSANTGIHQHVIEPWQKLCAAAEKQGFELTIASGFRSFDRQLAIWNKKCLGQLDIKDIDNKLVDLNRLSDDEIIEAILTFSALPGASRHHWGTDVDFYDKSALTAEQSIQLEPWEYQKNGPFFALTQWLNQHATSFGFYFPYDKYRGGIAAEPWHLSYYPIAENCQKQFTQEKLYQCLQSSDIQLKAKILTKLTVIYNQYITNIGHNYHG